MTQARAVEFLRRFAHRLQREGQNRNRVCWIDVMQKMWMDVLAWEEGEDEDE